MPRGIPGSARPDNWNAISRQRHEDVAEIVIPAVETPEDRQRALEDPIFFCERMTGGVVHHAIPPLLQDYVREVVRAARQGGNVLVTLPRGGGKTTLLSAALLYCLVAGIVRFPVVVAASQTAANALLKNILAIITNSDPLLWAFPDVAFPFRSAGGNWQRAAHQHVRGVKTGILMRQGTLHLPDLPDENGAVRRGATLVARGAGSAVRGLVDADGSRPDFVIVDDPLKAASARSDTQQDALEKYILEDLRGLAGSDSAISVFVTATPLAPNDIVARLEKRADFRTIRHPLVSRWPDAKEHWEEYTRLLYGDLVNGGSAAHDFYLANRAAMDKGGELLDPLAFPPSMASAWERVYYLRATMGPEAFNQEYQLQTKTHSSQLRLDATEVSKRLSLVPHRVVPAECKALIASIDVGTATALHVLVLALGPGQIATIVDAYRYPDSGPLLPKNLPEPQIDKRITAALVYVVNNLCARGRYRQEGTGKPMSITAIGIDRGYRTQTIDRVAAYYLRKRINVFPMKGTSNPSYRPSKYTIAQADGIDLRENNGARYALFNADVFKALALSGLAGEPMTAGALSLWGSDSSEVFPVAQELAGEQLLEILPSRYGDTYRWASSSVGVQNHFLDDLAMALALATFLRFRLPESVAAIAHETEAPGNEPDNPDKPQPAPAKEPARPQRKPPYVNRPAPHLKRRPGRIRIKIKR